MDLPRAQVGLVLPVVARPPTSSAARPLSPASAMAYTSHETTIYEFFFFLILSCSSMGGQRDSTRAQRRALFGGAGTAADQRGIFALHHCVCCMRPSRGTALNWWWDCRSWGIQGGRQAVEAHVGHTHDMYICTGENADVAFGNGTSLGPTAAHFGLWPRPAPLIC